MSGMMRSSSLVWRNMSRHLYPSSSRRQRTLSIRAS
jgi:hypothetical protein